RPILQPLFLAVLARSQVRRLNPLAHWMRPAASTILWPRNTDGLLILRSMRSGRTVRLAMLALLLPSSPRLAISGMSISSWRGSTVVPRPAALASTATLLLHYLIALTT